jgi:hypothetical protein
VLAQRRQWFEKLAETYLVLWWVPAGTVPTVEDAKVRLEMLRRDGPTADAFTFRSPFPPPGRAGVGEPVSDDWFCPA